MVHIRKDDNKSQLFLLIVVSSILTHVFGNQIMPFKLVEAAGTGSGTSASSSETTSSSQPLWSYQVKPNSYINAANTQSGAYGPGGGGGGYVSVGNGGFPSIFDTINGLSQRQGALSGSPFLSILPIILIAAGGMLLLLPFLTMMMASPFGGGFGGGYQNGFGYPQVGALKKKRASDGSPLFDNNQLNLIDLFEQVSSSIEGLTKKYSNQANNNSFKRFKSLNSMINQQQPNEVTPPLNHRSTLSNAAAQSAGAAASASASLTTIEESATGSGSGNGNNNSNNNNSNIS